jgi:hypothetical protein
VFGARIEPVLKILRTLRSSGAAWEQTGVFTSKLALNASLFAVLFLASIRLQADDFAKLSLTNNSVMQLANLFGFGLDFAALILSIETKNGSFVAINFIVKTALYVFAMFIMLFWTSLVELRFELVIFAAAAGVALWASSLTVIQYEREFMRFALMNGMLALTRIVLGIAAAFMQSWMLIIFAVHVLAQLPIHVITLARGVRDFRSVIEWRKLGRLLAFSPLIFASGTLLGALPIVTQSVLYSRTDALAASAFGVVLIFTAPLNTLVATLEIYLLPQALSRRNQDIDVFDLGGGSMKFLAFGFAGGFLIGTAPVAAVLDWIYGNRMPLVSPFFIIYFGGAVLSNSLSFYNLRAQRSNLVRIALMVNLCRAIATALLGFFPWIGSWGIVVSSAGIMVAGEVALWAILSRTEQSDAKRR